MQSITLIPGDGIGPEIVSAVHAVFSALDIKLKITEAKAGGPALADGLDLIPPETLAQIEASDATLKGPITTPIGRGFSSVNVSLRQHFKLFANVRPVLSLPGTKARYTDIDLIVIRENLEGLYSGVGHRVSDDGETAELQSIVTRQGSERIVDHAFKTALHLGRHKVTLVHKANIMKSTSGLFLTVGREVASRYPAIEFEEMIVDNCAMQLVMNPERFDVLVTTNLFGDILSDLCSGLIGGLGLAPGANLGQSHAIFEAVHGSAPDIAGQDKANPTAILLASAMMLDHLNLKEDAERIRRAIERTLSIGEIKTPDLGGHHGTRAYTEALIQAL
ncbi:MAG: isocitrate dehydrogenase [Pseudomonadales bacterium]